MKKHYFLLILLSAFSNAFAQEDYMIVKTGGGTCEPGDCSTYELLYPEIRQTTGYDVASINYNANDFPSTGAGTTQLPLAEDSWAPVITLPFAFCFYGQTYNSILVGSNGVLTFETAFFSGIGCPWEFSAPIPDSTFPVRNAIYGVYQSNTSNTTASPTQSMNYFVTGTAPNRVFVVNFYRLPSFQCTNQLQTSQIILHETTNIIDIFVNNRTSCPDWSNPNGLIGVQNPQGTLATTPPGRNTGTWNASSEAWRFSPNGAESASISWSFEGEPIEGNGYILDFCPPEMGVLTATIAGSSCGMPTSQSFDFETMFGPMDMGLPQDLYGCSADGMATFDLTSNDEPILAGQDPYDYDIYYFLTQTDAESGANAILGAQNFNGMDGQTIYSSVFSWISGCLRINSFTLHVDAPPTAPIGATAQDFTSGQTLADLDVTGVSIQWYADEDLTIPLPSTTPLEDGVTYYALETYMPPACSDTTGRSAQESPYVLAVTVTLQLSTVDFGVEKISIFPNPAKQSVNVTASETIVEVKMYSLSGQLLMERKSEAGISSIDLSSLTTGTYILKAKGNRAIHTARIVRE